MTQDFSSTILKAIESNDYIIKITTDNFYDDLMSDFRSRKPIMNRYCCITNKNGEYHTISKDLNTPKEAGFENLYSYNFKFGAPLIFVACRFNITATDDHGREQEGIYLTEQTPYKTKRKIFLKLKNSQGIPVLMEDGYFSLFAKMDPTVLLYDNLIYRISQLPN